MEYYTIDNMSLNDIKDIMEVERLSFTAPWSEKMFRLELSNNKNAIYRVIRVNGKAIAYGGFWILFDESHVMNIAVHPRHRGNGYGNALLEDMIKVSKEANVKSMTLEVRVSNEHAIKLYEKNGFKVEGLRKEYYRDTKEDAFIMWNHSIGC